MRDLHLALSSESTKINSLETAKCAFLAFSCLNSLSKKAIFVVHSVPMIPIYLHPELATWAKEQVFKGVAPSVEALVTEAVVARKRDGEWLDKLVKGTLHSVEREGWVDGDAVLHDIDIWLNELDVKIEAYEAFLQDREMA
jgi:hypothetical protein